MILVFHKLQRNCGPKNVNMLIKFYKVKFNVLLLMASVLYVMYYISQKFILESKIL